MQHLREILEEIEANISWTADTLDIAEFSKNTNFFKGLWKGLNVSQEIILRKITELEEKGEC